MVNFFFDSLGIVSALSKKWAIFVALSVLSEVVLGVKVIFFVKL